MVSLLSLLADQLPMSGFTGIKYPIDHSLVPHIDLSMPTFRVVTGLAIISQTPADHNFLIQKGTLFTSQGFQLGYLRHVGALYTSNLQGTNNEHVLPLIYRIHTLNFAG